MRHIRQKSLPFNATALGAWAESRRLNSMPFPVRVLARRRNLPPWRAIAIAEISGFGGLSNDR